MRRTKELYRRKNDQMSYEYQRFCLTYLHVKKISMSVFVCGSFFRLVEIVLIWGVAIVCHGRNVCGNSECSWENLSIERQDMINTVNDVVRFHLSSCASKKEINCLSLLHDNASCGDCVTETNNLIELRFQIISVIGNTILEIANDLDKNDLEIVSSFRQLTITSRSLLSSLLLSESQMVCSSVPFFVNKRILVQTNFDQIVETTLLPLMIYVEPFLALMGKLRYHVDVLLLGDEKVDLDLLNGVDWVMDESGYFSRSVPLENFTVVDSNDFIVPPSPDEISFGPNTYCTPSTCPDNIDIDANKTIIVYEKFPSNLTEDVAKVVPLSKHPSLCWQRYLSPATYMDSMLNCIGHKVGLNNEKVEDLLTRLVHRETKGTLIYSCRGYKPCGGNGDRINGIVHVFLMSILLRRRFLIDSEFPLPIEYVFAPNMVDWRMPPDLVPDIAIDFIDKRREMFAAAKTNHDIISAEHVAINANHLLMMSVLHEDMREIPFLFSHLFRFLFRPTKLLTSLVSIRKPYLGIHFRSGDHGTWYDPARHSLGELEKFFVCARKMAPNIPWVLFSDVLNLADLVDHVPEYVSGQLTLFDAEAVPVHTDRSSVEANVHGGFLRAWAGWLAMSQAAGLVISRSFYSETAARIARMSGTQVSFYDACVSVDLA